MNTEGKLSRELQVVEHKLQESLRPVKAPAVFVADLRGRLDQEMVKKMKNRKVRIGLLVAGGVLGLIALIITLIRSLTSWDKLLDSIQKYLPRIRKREQAASI